MAYNRIEALQPYTVKAAKCVRYQMLLHYKRNFQYTSTVWQLHLKLGLGWENWATIGL